MVIDISALLASAKKVDKDWGAEYWVTNNDIRCAKVLVLNPGYQCSLHYHKIKDEEFHVIDGHVHLERDGFSHYLSPGNSMRITPNMVHRFSSLNGATILELSTHHADSDTYRVENSRKM